MVIRSVLPNAAGGNSAGHVNKPEILMADEPTGNLDTKRSAEIISVLKELNVNVGLTIIMVTHNQELARHAGKMLEMKDGAISRIH